MLLQFNVKNFMSIKNEIVLSLIATPDKKHSDSLLNINNEKVLPSIAIYGANAAGKSNVFKALSAAISLVRNSNYTQINTNINLVPFLLDEESKNDKTKLDFKFIYNGIKYEYGFVADQFNIYEEYLYEYKTSRPAMVFERTNINDYKFRINNNDLKQFVEKNTHNKLFLCTATAWNCKITKNAYMWFVENIDTYTALDIQINNSYFKEIDKHNEDSNFKPLLLEMLKHADINISDYDFESLEKYKLTTHHLVEIDNSIKDYKLDIKQESDGTKIMFAYAPIIIDALNKGKTIIIDEIDSCLHPILLAYLVSIFNNPKQNKNGAQLIFNTHDINLLDLDKLRRDQIYFVEKNNTSGITDLYSLVDYSPRNSENIRKGYMQGRYGAIPVILGGYECLKG